MTRTVVSTQNAPAAVGPYSQAIIANGMVFTAGQVALDPATKKLVEGDIRVQTEQVLKNLRAVLEAAGTSLDKAVKTTVFLKDMNDFATLNEVYGTAFTQNPPARTTIQVARLPLDALVEIEVVALL